MGSENEHLTTEQLEALLHPAPGEQHTEAERHVAACEVCRGMMQRQRVADALLAAISQGKQRGRTPVCFAVEDWPSVVAGLMTPREIEESLAHAADCDWCGPLLRRAAENFSEDVSDQEEQTLAKLKTSEREWQRRFSARITAGLTSGGQVETKRWRIRYGWPKWALASAAAIILSLGIFWWSHRDSSDGAGRVTQMLTRAFTEHRTTELRFPGAAYGPVMVLRGPGGSESAFDRPAALLEAEARIAHELRVRPDDPVWLQMKARADLIEGARPQAAIAVLERLLEEKPADNLVRLDLASAYFQRGEAMNRPIDYGKAVDLLGVALRSEPNHAVALFNRAILLEKLFLYDQAEADWKRYLELDANSEWATEARSRLSDLQEKIRAKKRRSAIPLESPSRVAELWSQGSPGEISAMDARAEMYLEEARKTWLTAAFPENDPNNEMAHGGRLGLRALAELLQKRHQDTWLKDFLASGGHDPNFGSSVALLSRAYRMSLTGDHDPAIILSADAAARFRRAGNRAGWLEARWQMLYATRLSVRVAGCVALSGRLWDEVAGTSYHWLRARTLLEYADCSSLANRPEQASHLNDLAAQASAGHQYPVLALASLKLAADIDEDIRALPAAFALAARGLQLFWTGDYPYLSGYNLCNTMMESANYEQQWRLTASISREALDLLPGGRDAGWESYTRQKLANALLMSGDLAGARASLLGAQKLLTASPEGEATRNRAAEVETGIGTIELLQGKPAQAVERLSRIRQQVEKASRGYLVIDFFSTYGKALGDTGQYKQSEEAISQAIRAAESALPTLNSEQQRLVWSRRSEGAYREMVRLQLRADPSLAFAWWQSFKGASIRERPAVSPDPLSAPLTCAILAGDRALVSYAVFPDGVIAWVFDCHLLEYRWIPAAIEELEPLARRFAAHCSNPASNLGALREEGRHLYSIFFAPIEGLLRGRTSVILEPDGVLEHIAFEALVDRSGKYLAERLQFSYSPGLYYLAASGAAAPLPAQSRALVAAVPLAYAGVGLAGLPDVESEARIVATTFRSSTLLLSNRASAAAIARELPHVDVFHFAGHAIVDANGSGLVLQAPQSGNEPELFTGIQFSRALFARVRLVVLSACSSAQGSDGSFTSSDSLARTLLSSGVPQVIASRWPVNSSSTTTLMENFYSVLRTGLPAAESLRIAEKRLREQTRWNHPYYWAAFATFGRT